MVFSFNMLILSSTFLSVWNISIIIFIMIFNDFVCCLTVLFLGLFFIDFFFLFTIGYIFLLLCMPSSAVVVFFMAVIRNSTLLSAGLFYLLLSISVLFWEAVTC